MKHLRTWITALVPLAASLQGCDLEPDQPEPQAWLEREVVVPDDALERACDPGVQIARRASGGCGDVGQWHGASLFDVGTPWLEEHDAAEVPGALGRFCQYEWTGAGDPSPNNLANLTKALGGDPVGPSCQAISPQGDALSDALGVALRAWFRWNGGRPTQSDLDLPTTGTTEPLVTALVVDTQPSDEDAVPTTNHGRLMGHIIGDVACPGDDPSCRVEVMYVVGLPRVAPGEVDYERGGRVGTHADLAAAIYEGVRRWEQANATRTTPSKLVVSLSVGWEPDVFGGTENQPAPALAAVRTALELASCKGAVIVASVGNEGDFCGAAGPMLPAAWEVRAAPGETRCGELGAPLAAAPGGGYQPLVHAVGGLGLDLGRMPRTRPSADPRLMAASTHAFVGNPIRGGVTGTSVGTAVTAAAAALVWSYRPSLPASAVMGWVYGSGDPLPGMSVDFALPGMASGVAHRVDACAALSAACSEPSTDCPDMPLGCLTTAAPVTSSIDDALEAASPVVELAVSTPSVDGSCSDACGAGVSIFVPDGHAADCDALAVDPVEALVNPTPDSIGCPTCGIQDLTLLMSTHQAYDDRDVESVLVTLTDDQGNVRRYDLGPLPLSSGTVTRVELDPTAMPPGTVKAGDVTISFEGMEVRTTDPLLVL